MASDSLCAGFWASSSCWGCASWWVEGLVGQGLQGLDDGAWTGD